MIPMSTNLILYQFWLDRSDLTTEGAEGAEEEKREMSTG